MTKILATALHRGGFARVQVPADSQIDQESLPIDRLQNLTYLLTQERCRKPALKTILYHQFQFDL
jgi:hypothetical protein